MARCMEIAAETSSSLAARLRSRSVSSVSTVDSVMTCMKIHDAQPMVNVAPTNSFGRTIAMVVCLPSGRLQNALANPLSIR